MAFRLAPIAFAGAFLGVIAISAQAADRHAEKNLFHANLKTMVPVSRTEEVTVVRPIKGMITEGYWQTELTLLPAHCHLAFESASGALYPCALRVAHVRSVVGGKILMSTRRQNAVLWRSPDGSAAKVLIVPSVAANSDDARLLKSLRGGSYIAIPMVAGDWATAVSPGRLDAALVSLQPSAGQAAFAAASRESKKTTHSLPAASADKAVIWGDFRAEGEVVIRKLDGKTQWHVPLNGYAQAIVAEPGAHQLALIMLSENLKPDIDVLLVAGHTYIAGFGIDEKPYLDDLGVGVHCERRKISANAKSLHERAWLACIK